MAVSNQNINRVDTDPELADVLNYFKKSVKLEINCHHIGKIQAFDPITQTATVTINYSKTFLKAEKDGTFSTAIKDFPPIKSCPVIIMGGGHRSLTFPILPGDDCILLFNDRDIDNWFAGSSSSPPATGRLHSFSDAICLVGLRPEGEFIDDYDNDAVALNYGTTKVRVGEDKVSIMNATNTLNDLLQDLLTELQNLATNISILTVTCSTPGSPSSLPTNAADFLTIQSNIATIASDIGDLLE